MKKIIIILAIFSLYSLAAMEKVSPRTAIDRFYDVCYEGDEQEVRSLLQMEEIRKVAAGQQEFASEDPTRIKVVSPLFLTLKGADKKSCLRVLTPTRSNIVYMLIGGNANPERLMGWSNKHHNALSYLITKFELDDTVRGLIFNLLYNYAVNPDAKVAWYPEDKAKAPSASDRAIERGDVGLIDLFEAYRKTRTRQSIR